MKYGDNNIIMGVVVAVRWRFGLAASYFGSCPTNSHSDAGRAGTFRKYVVHDRRTWREEAGCGVLVRVNELLH